MKDTLTGLAGMQTGLFRVSTEVVIFTIRDETLRVLLRRQSNDATTRIQWGLPGGYVNTVEPPEHCAGRTLAEQTGMRGVFLEQLYTSGQPDRPSGPREISVAYYALVSLDRAAAVDSGRQGKWCDVDSLSDLYLDHERIIQAARERLAAKLEYSTIAFQLMPEYFTLSELQQVYETVCDRSIDKRNFRKRVLALKYIEPTERMRRNGSHRPARLYRYTARDAIHYLK